jgi:elongation factor G
MDSMELERERGITIQSAATYCTWDEDTHINIIDTPGHVDFTVEVERALRCLDGAVLVLCGVSGVQSQSITVDRQMKRYNVPRIAFINKLDRSGANPWKVIEDLRTKLRHNATAVQVPIGLEAEHDGVVDLVKMKALLFKGDFGEKIVEEDIPDDMQDECDEHRATLIERLADVDDDIAELYLMEEEPTEEQLLAGLRRATIARTMTPVYMGSAFKNRGVQPLLDGVRDLLPSPLEHPVSALDLNNNEAKVDLEVDASKPLVSLAFKLEEGRFGQLTYLRVYQGTLKRGDWIVNTSTGKRIKVPRLVRMNSDDMEDVESVGAGEICAMFGVDCSSGDTFASDGVNVAMTSMFVPEPVISLSVEPGDRQKEANFSKALQRFKREDPTFRVHMDPDSKQTIISGMGELHLEVYCERMAREYDCPVTTGVPQVAYRESLGARADFNYLHKKQSGGSGQYGRVVGYLEPLPKPDPVYDEDGNEVEDDEASAKTFEFVNGMIGNAIPPEYINAVEKGFRDAIGKGALAGHPVQNVRVTLTDGQAHVVDSSEMAFRIAARDAFRHTFPEAKPVILEPVMRVDVEAPEEFQGTIVGGLNKRKGVIQNTELKDEGTYVNVLADVPLAEMFGYSTELRSGTQGKGEVSHDGHSTGIPTAPPLPEGLLLLFLVLWFVELLFLFPESP